MQNSQNSELKFHASTLKKFPFNIHWQMNEFDAIDLRLLTALQEDASLSNQDLAARVAVSPATCLRRVKRLVDS